MKKIFFNKARALISATLLLTSTAIALTGAKAQQPAPAYSVIAAWIGDHDYILPYRKEALPFVLEQGASWTHLYFPDSFYEKGFDLTAMPDEMHIVRFNSLDHMQSIFSAPEYIEPAEKYFYKAFSDTLAFPAVGGDPTANDNGNFNNYFAIGMMDLPAGANTINFLNQLKESARAHGLKSATSMTVMMPPESGAPTLALISSFNDKSSFDTYMNSKGGRKFFEEQTTRFMIAGGYDTKRPVK